MAEPTVPSFFKAQSKGDMKKKLAKVLTGWIPSGRYRRAVRRALCDVPQPHKTPIVGFQGEETGTYEQLVVTRGFVNSGSGVIVDLLSEYDDVTVCGGADPECSGRRGRAPAGGGAYEIDLFRMYGGVADLAAAFGESHAWGRVKLQNFIHLAEFLHRKSGCALYGDRFMKLTREFVDELVEARWKTQAPLAEALPFEMCSAPPDLAPDMMNPLYGWRENLAEAYVLKTLTKDQYVEIAGRYMRDVLALIPSRRTLVADQLLSVDMPLENCRRYFGDFKMVSVWRDPRDVYCQCARQGVTWIPYDPAAFVAWYRESGIRGLRKSASPQLLMLRFEELVTEYERSVGRVEEFLGLAPSSHVRPRTGFDPARSIRNVGIHREHPDQAAMAYIARELGEYCFEGSVK